MASMAIGAPTRLLLGIIAAISNTGHRAALIGYLRRHTPAELLREVLGDEESLRRAAYASYRHANGFDKLLLASSPQGHSIKLDVWWPDDPRGQEDTHNHRYSFSSHLLVGKFSMEHYELRDTGTPMDHFNIQIAGGRTDRLHYRGQRKVEQLFDIAVLAGATYSLHHAQLHRVAAPPGTLSATLVFQGHNARDTSDVFRPPGSGRPEQCYNAPFEEAEMAERLERLLGILG